MAIVVTAPETVNDADINELYALEKHLMIISEGDPDNVYCGEGDDTILEEALPGYEDMPSELIELVKPTGAIFQKLENVFHPNEVINKLFDIEWGYSEIC